MLITKKNVLTLLCSAFLIAGITFSAWLIPLIPQSWLRTAAKVSLTLLNGAVALVALRTSGIPFRLEFRSWKPYALGLLLALLLSLVIAVIPSLFGVYFVGLPTEFSLAQLLSDFCFFLLVIGPVEELVFRVYLQEALCSFFPGRKWLGVVLAALLFGLWHWINGNLMQVMFTFLIGLYFGFAKYKVKGCGYVGVALGHGLYDALNTLVRMLLP